MSGRLTSSTTRSGALRPPAASASWPVAASTTVEARRRAGRGWSSSASPGCRRRRGSRRRISASSSHAVAASSPARAAAVASGSRSGIVTENVEPWPTSLSTVDVAAEQDAPASCSATGPGRCRAGASGSASRPARNPGTARGGAPAAMPMPVSVDREGHPVVVDQRRRDPHFALGRELQRVRDEVAQDLRQLLVVGVDARDAVAAPRRPATPTSVGRIGLNMPRSAENRSTISNHAGEMVTRPASTLARSSRSLTISVSSRADGLDELDLLLLLGGQRAVQPRPAGCRAMLRIEPSGVRNSWLMYDRKRLLSSEASRSRRGVVVELGVERDHALVGLGQLGRQRNRPAHSSRRESRCRRSGDGLSHRAASAIRAGDDHDRRVVAAAHEVAVQHAGDDRRMARAAGPGTRPATSALVRPSECMTSSAAAGHAIVELLHAAASGRRRCRSG